MVSWARGRTEVARDTKVYLKGKEMFYILIVTLVTGMYTFAKTQETIYLK